MCRSVSSALRTRSLRYSSFVILSKTSCPSCLWLFSSFYIWKIHVRGHPRTQALIIARESNLDAEYLFDPICYRLHVARCEFGLAINLLDHAIEIFSGKRIDLHANMVAYLDVAQPGLRHVNADPKMSRQEQSGGFAIGRQDIAHFHAKHLQN